MVLTTHYTYTDISLTDCAQIVADSLLPTTTFLADYKTYFGQNFPTVYPDNNYLLKKSNISAFTFATKYFEFDLDSTNYSSGWITTAGYIYMSFVMVGSGGNGVYYYGGASGGVVVTHKIEVADNSRIKFDWINNYIALLTNRNGNNVVVVKVGNGGDGVSLLSVGEGLLTPNYIIQNYSVYINTSSNSGSEYAAGVDGTTSAFVDEDNIKLYTPLPTGYGSGGSAGRTGRGSSTPPGSGGKSYCRVYFYVA